MSAATMKSARWRILGRDHRRLVDAISAATSLSAHRVTAAGNALSEVIEDAQGHALAIEEFQDSMDDRLRWMDPTDQQARVAVFTRTIDATLDEQSLRVRQAVRICRELAATIEQLSVISLASRHLGLHTRIQAVRLSNSTVDAGGTADELAYLNADLDEVSTSIRKMVADMLRLLPTLGREASAMRDRTRRFSTDLTRSVTALGHETDRLRHAVAEQAWQVDTQIGHMLEHSRTALTHLQFQDPMIQSVQRADSMSSELLSTLGSELSLADSVDSIQYAMNIGIVDEDFFGENEMPDSGDFNLF